MTDPGPSKAGNIGPGEAFVYRTLHLYEADMVANEFERAGIAHYRAEESPTGIRFAMPAAPSFAPGLQFLVIAHAVDAQQARELVESLPVSNEASPGVWASGMGGGVRKFFRTWAWLTLVAFAASFVAGMVSCFRS